MDAALRSLSGIRGKVSYEIRRAGEVARTLGNQWWKQSRNLAQLKRDAKLNPTKLTNLSPRWTLEVNRGQFPDFPEIRPGAPMVFPWRNSPEWFFHNLEPPKSR